MGDDTDMTFLLRHELSDREVFCIGDIVVLWAMLEHEIFLQTLDSFSEEEIAGELPSAMSNLNADEVRKLWKSRVIDNHDPLRKKVLSEQLERITQLKDYRNAIVHGMWDFSKKDVVEISSTRFRKREQVVFSFTTNDLEQFQKSLMKVNFYVRYPADIEDRAEEMTQSGGYMSRSFLAAITGHPLAKELFPVDPADGSIPAVSSETAGTEKARRRPRRRSS
jgi:hypothetical protein